MLDGAWRVPLKPSAARATGFPDNKKKAAAEAASRN
jgi:hypothetical protein